MLGIIAAKSSFYKKHTAPYLNIVKALFSSAKNDGWKIVSQKGLVDPEAKKLIATAIVKDLSKINMEFDLKSPTTTEVFHLHEKVGNSMIEALSEGKNCIATMVISDPVYGQTSYETYIV